MHIHRLFGTMTMAVAARSVDAKEISISNVLPRYNVSGEIMDAHDGTYNQWVPGGPWYYYAMGYGTCKQGQDLCHGCGYGYSWIGVWKSANMTNGTWTLVREARDSSWPKATYFRVHTVYNKHTQLYVMWANVNGIGWDFVVGTSPSPEGPFTFKNKYRSSLPGGGDFDIFIDDDAANSAYIIYTSTKAGHVMSIEQLTPDYLSSMLVPPSPPAPAPTPPAPSPPAPAPTPPGFTHVGNGGCRDSAGLEPHYYTDERTPLDPLSESLCISTCVATAGCLAVASCNGNPNCNGACHLYTASQIPPAGAHAAEWRWSPGQDGDPAKVTTVHPGEAWWSCLAKTPRNSNVPAHITAITVPLHLPPHDVLLASAVSHHVSGQPPAAANKMFSGPTNVSSGVFGNVFVEAPAMFKRFEVYYALFGNCCCFCGHGSGIGVYTATKPLGPWTYRNNVGCKAGTVLKPGCGCGMNHGTPEGPCNNYGHSLTTAQQNFVIQVPDPTTGKIQYVWTGDRWQSASDGIKAHDLQYWSVLNFARDTASGIDLPTQFAWQDTITFNI